MPSLSDLPTELLQAILVYTTKADNLSLSTVNRRLSDEARARLYQDITLEWKTEEIPPVCKLLQTLIEHKELRTLVRSLHLSGQGPLDIDIHTPVIPLALDADKASSIIRSTRFPHVETWETAFREGNLDAILALLVTLLPQLIRLSVIQNFARDSRILSRTVFYAAQSPTPEAEAGSDHDFRPDVSKLLDVTICQRRIGEALYRAIRPFKNTPAILGWFYLPSVQRLSLSIDNPFDFAWPSPLPPKPQHLETLFLDQIREYRALPILAACPRVKELNWNLRHEAGPDSDVLPDPPVVDLQALTAALAPLRDSLEVLTLGGELVPGESELDVPPVTYSGILDLAILTKVRTLSVPWIFYMGKSLQEGKTIGHPSTVPPRLTRLIIDDGFEYDDSTTWEDPEMRAAARKFLEEYRPQYTPHLRELGLHPGLLEDVSRDELEPLAEKLGLAFASDTSIFKTRCMKKPPLPFCWTWDPPPHVSV
ncbi:hypothetical protein B0T11DRAFT_285400 [Plectosphaerella cucumerina]|uniref:F-box domain-containing protein n=1 Tax=Plectosphaerella cucumerina TaxID=40658 RepID=A0A8K0TBM9_9PEZI|nr:hypothetical protein B0T11DRAFT_285400 [Plectosphaerella cucumerina]